jgi:hypothetical protein
MKQLLLIVMPIFSQALLYGQVNKPDLSKVNTSTEAEAFIQSHPEYEAKLFSIEPGQDLAEISPQIFSRKPGHSFKIGPYSYKIVGIDSTLSFRVSYIYLDGSKYSKTEIDKIRQEIISNYRSGVKFTDLVSKYNMDGNASGDTYWFAEKMMVEEFEKAIRSHKKGDIFTVDMPDQNWFHVVLKTFSDTYIKKLAILKVKSS